MQNVKSIAWIGLGQMGVPMVQHLLQAEYEVGVYNRDIKKAQSLATQGAKAYSSIAELVADYQTIFVMVSDYAAIVSLFDEPILRQLAGKTVVNMSTVSPTQNLALDKLFRSYQANFVEAPVSGSSKAAEAGQLLTLVGGNAEDLLPLFQAFSVKVLNLGEVGKASGMKLVLNGLLGMFGAAYSEALLLGEQFGIDKDVLLNTISNSGMNSPVFQAKLSMYQNQQFPPAFMLKHMAKDLRLIEDELKQANRCSPLLDMANQSYEQALAQDLGELDMAAVYRFFQNI